MPSHSVDALDADASLRALRSILDPHQMCRGSMLLERIRMPTSLHCWQPRFEDDMSRHGEPVRCTQLHNLCLHLPVAQRHQRLEMAGSDVSRMASGLSMSLSSKSPVLRRFACYFFTGPFSLSCLMQELCAESSPVSTLYLSINEMSGCRIPRGSCQRRMQLARLCSRLNE